MGSSFPNVMLESGRTKNQTKNGQAAKACRFSVHICYWRMHGWRDGWMGGWTDRWIITPVADIQASG